MRPNPKDHPRSCGEHWAVLLAVDAFEGSSPLVRGAPTERLVRALCLGIIPARAGSTAMIFRRFYCCWDHPRSCGEHMVNGALKYKGEGSSPLVRGALLQQIAIDGVARIIPARAGSTPPYRTCRRLTRDHPRSCGEHCRFPSAAGSCQGSSPLVRGARMRKFIPL